MFLIDGSSSIKPLENFLRCKDFVKDIVEIFNISLTESHIGVVQFASRAKIEFGLNKYYSKADVNNAIDAIRQERGSTNINVALMAVKDEVFGAVDPRPKVPRILIVMTDGHTDENLKPLSLELQKRATVFAIGIGNDYSTTQLRDMASDPKEKHAYVTGFPQLTTIAKLIRNNACPGNANYISITIVLTHVLLNIQR